MKGDVVYCDCCKGLVAPEQEFVYLIRQRGAPSMVDPGGSQLCATCLDRLFAWLRLSSGELPMCLVQTSFGDRSIERIQSDNITSAEPV